MMSRHDSSAPGHMLELDLTAHADGISGSATAHVSFDP
jgi:hypothetical protein